MEKKLEIMISYANELSGVLELVINNHLEEDRPMILEGDFISPLLCKKLLQDSDINARIKCMFIIEDDKEQIIQNYLNREGSIQTDRSELSLRYNNWIKEQIEGTDIIAVDSAPWESSIERICDVLNRE